MNVKDIRRENLRLLAHENGGIAEIARRLNKSTSQISHLIGPNPIKNIGDRIASEVENIFEKPSGWLDYPQVGNDQTMPNNTEQKIYQVPLLTWEQAITWVEAPEQLANNHHLPISSRTASAQAFALQIQNDVMESQHGMSFPQGCYIIIDPQNKPQGNDFVLVKSARNQQLLFRQLVIDGDRQYLKPLNQRYPVTALPHDAELKGSIVQMIMDI